jgi:GTP-binding protein HflX
VEDRPRLHVLNKIDRLAEEDLSVLKSSNGRHQQTVFTSAVTGAGLEELAARIDAAMPVDPLTRLRFRVPVSDGRHLSLLHAGGRVLHSAVSDGHLFLDAEIPESLARKLQAFIWRDAPGVEGNLDAEA